MPQSIQIHAGGRTLAMTGPVQSYLDLHAGWNADAASVAKAARDLPPASVCLDVGANIGFIALSLAAQRPDCHVIAIEPVPANVDALRANLQASGLTNVEVVHAAVGDRAGEVTLTNEGPWSSVAAPGPSTVRVPCIPLDDLAGRRAAFVKIDVEGYEPHVVAGAGRVFAGRPLVHMEFNLWWLLVRHFDSIAFTEAIWSHAEVLGVWHQEQLHPAPASAGAYLHMNIAEHGGIDDLMFRPKGPLPDLRTLVGQPASVTATA